MKNKVFNKICISFLWLSILLFFSGLLLLSFFNHAIADDYYALFWNNKYGFLGYQKYVYLHWGGRYFSNILASIFSSHQFLIKHYYFHTLFLLLSTVTSINWLLKVVNRFIISNSVSFFHRITIAALICINIYVAFPEFNTALYWFSSAITYQTSFILLVLLFTACISLVYTSHHKRFFLFLFIAALILLINGTNELAAIIAGFILLLMFMFNKKLFLNRKGWLILLIAIYVISFTILATAPGNKERLALIGNTSFNLQIAMASSLFRIFIVYWNIFQSPLFWISIFSLFIYTINCQVQLKGLKKISVNFKNILISLLIWSAILLITLLPLMLFSNGSFPDRAINLLTEITMMVLFFIVFYIGTFIREKNILAVANNSKLFYLLLIIISSCIYANRGSKEIVSSIISAKLYSDILSDREIKLEMASVNKSDSLFLSSVEVEMNKAVDVSSQKAMIKEWMRKKPSLICFQDDMADSSTRKIFQEYYNIRVISSNK